MAKEYMFWEDLLEKKVGEMTQEQMALAVEMLQQDLEGNKDIPPLDVLEALRLFRIHDMIVQVLPLCARFVLKLK